jgi:hypothetical protein
MTVLELKSFFLTRFGAGSTGNKRERWKILAICKKDFLKRQRAKKNFVKQHTEAKEVIHTFGYCACSYADFARGLTNVWNAESQRW